MHLIFSQYFLNILYICSWFSSYQCTTKKKWIMRSLKKFHKSIFQLHPYYIFGHIESYSINARYEKQWNYDLWKSLVINITTQMLLSRHQKDIFFKVYQSNNLSISYHNEPCQIIQNNEIYQQMKYQ